MGGGSTAAQRRRWHVCGHNAATGIVRVRLGMPKTSRVRWQTVASGGEGKAAAMRHSGDGISKIEEGKQGRISGMCRDMASSTKGGPEREIEWWAMALALGKKCGHGGGCVPREGMGVGRMEEGEGIEGAG